MRDLIEINQEIRVLELKKELISISLNKLRREKYDAEYAEVSWEDAEKFFIENEDKISHGKHVLHCYRYQDGTWSLGHQEDISIKDNPDGTKEMWIGGYRNSDRFPRGNPLPVKRIYADQINKK